MSNTAKRLQVGTTSLKATGNTVDKNTQKNCEPDSKAPKRNTTAAFKNMILKIL